MKLIKTSTFDSLKRILHYSFDPIDWKYKNLTALEKKAISLDEFEKLKKLFRDR